MEKRINELGIKHKQTNCKYKPSQGLSFLHKLCSQMKHQDRDYDHESGDLHNKQKFIL